ncbi:MAG: hypothetical protein R3Y08_05205 [Rikenellaceae bacterium]
MRNKLLLSTLLLLGFSPLLAAAQQRTNEPWRERSPYEVTLGINLGTRDFYYNEYGFCDLDNNLITTRTLQMPSINLGFTYKLNKYITLGAIATYAQSNYAKSSTYDNSVVQNDYYRYVGIAPRIRFDWLNHKYVTLYSSFALGAALTSESDQISNTCTTSTTGYVEATYIGVKVGNRLFGFADLCSSSTGAIRVGIGYNFKSKK